MMITPISKLTFGVMLLLIAAGLHAETTTPATLLPCAELPSGKLPETELVRLVPDKSPGRVRVAWATESQTDVYGFNVLRSENAGGPYTPLNKAIIPGEGTTNVPSSYCFEDTGLERGRVYYYQVEEVTNSGGKSIIPGTAASRVKVKTVAEERAWLKAKAEQIR